MAPSINVFFFILTIILLIEIGFSRYTKSTLTALENVLKLSDNQLGFLGSSQQIGDISVCLFVSYFGGYRHRPKLLGAGCLLMALGAFMSALPHFLIPSHKILTHNRGYELDPPAGNFLMKYGMSLQISSTICMAQMSLLSEKLFPVLLDLLKLGVGFVMLSLSLFIFLFTVFAPTLCENTTDQVTFSEEKKVGDYARTYVGYYAIVVIGQIIFGFGMSPLKPLGFSYLDDNLDMRKSALLFGFLVSTQFAGGLVGFLLAAWTSFLWVDLGQPPPKITPRSPAWISAWWLGFVLFAALIAIIGPAFFCFPRKIKSRFDSDAYISKQHLDSNEDGSGDASKRGSPEGSALIRNDEAEDDTFIGGKLNSQGKREKLCQNLTTWSNNPFFRRQSSTEADLHIKRTDFTSKEQCSKLISSGKKLLTDKLFLLTIFASVFLWTYLSSYAVFVIKYMEQQFSMTTSRANVIYGLLSTPCTVIGTILGGIVINRCKLSLSGMFRYATILVVVGLVIHCVIYFYIYCNVAEVVTETNNEDLPQYCSCTNQFQPICASNITYFSPCIAGCKSFKRNFETKSLTFYNCTSSADSVATGGRCSSDCSSAIISFMVLNGFGAIFYGNVCSICVIIIVRILAHKNKSFGLGITLVCNKVLGAIPGPIIAGAIINQTCRIRGELGTCAVYDLPGFRLSFGFMLLVIKIFTVLAFAGGAYLTRNHPFVEKMDVDVEIKSPEALSDSEQSNK